MEPTIPAGSFILGTRLYGRLEVDDIIIFEKDGQYLVKRIAGCPGDKIDLEDIVFMDSIPVPSRESNNLTVPEKCYYVLGDNVQNSVDSRYWKDPFVSHERIVAIVK